MTTLSIRNSPLYPNIVIGCYALLLYSDRNTTPLIIKEQDNYAIVFCPPDDMYIILHLLENIINNAFSQIQRWAIHNRSQTLETLALLSVENRIPKVMSTG
jgi:hypothetical protein